MNLKSNKYDLLLIICLLFIAVISIIILNLTSKKAKYAYVYYDNKKVLEIDLSIDKKYKVKGYNGDVYIKVKDNKIKVDDEISPYHLCSKKGYISKSYESIVCLPNKIVIEINSDKSLDTVVK